MTPGYVYAASGAMLALVAALIAAERPARWLAGRLRARRARRTLRRLAPRRIERLDGRLWEAQFLAQRCQDEADRERWRARAYTLSQEIARIEREAALA